MLFTSKAAYKRCIQTFSDTIPQYHLLKEKLEVYEQVVRSNAEQPINFKTTDSLRLWKEVAQKLQLLGYIEDSHMSDSVTIALQKKISIFQKDHGLLEDGKLSQACKAMLNLPISKRILIIRENMERAARIPPMSAFQVMVNIPNFELEMYVHDTLVFQSDVIVGKRKTKTAIITGRFESIVINPYWNIPNSILQKEILPEIKRNEMYLKENDMEWIGKRLRQKPGNKNALGKIKFIFPNPYNMYLHDTPNKYLFLKRIRMFSHGCIRIAKPIELAVLILQKEKKNLSLELLNELIKKRREIFIPLSGVVQIVVYYMTAFVAANGHLNYRNDIYGLD